MNKTARLVSGLSVKLYSFFDFRHRWTPKCLTDEHGWPGYLRDCPHFYDFMSTLSHEALWSYKVSTARKIG